MSSASTPVTSASGRINGLELCAVASLAGIFALRMLGLFMIIPVFVVFAKTLSDGNNTQLVTFAIDMYGFAQTVFYIPYGWLSDHFGCKPTIVTGSAIFAMGSLVAVFSHSVAGITMGRAIQGAETISSAVITSVADLTCEEHRTRAMVMIGGGIGLSFAVAIVSVSVISRWVGMPGMPTAIDVLAIVAVGAVLWVVFNLPRPPGHVRASLREALRHPELLRLNLGAFALHAAQTTLFVVLPHILKAAGLPVDSRWRIYLPVMGVSFVLMVSAIIAVEERGKMETMLLSAMALVMVAQLALDEVSPTLTVLTTALLVCSLGFNILEASQSSLVLEYAPGVRKGAAMGAYNTAQTLGLSADGAGGGWILLHVGQRAVFLICAALVFAWLIIASPIQMSALHRH